MIENCYRGIDVATFLSLCAANRDRITSRNVEAQLKKIRAWKVHEKGEYKLERRNYEEAETENSMNSHFVKMGNMFIEYAEKHTCNDIGTKRQVRLVAHNHKTLTYRSAARKPDIVLVPKTVTQRVIRRKQASVPEVLAPFELKVDNTVQFKTGVHLRSLDSPGESVARKRFLEDVESSDDDESEGRNTKRAKAALVRTPAKSETNPTQKEQP